MISLHVYIGKDYNKLQELEKSLESVRRYTSESYVISSSMALETSAKTLNFGDFLTKILIWLNHNSRSRDAETFWKNHIKKGPVHLSELLRLFWLVQFPKKSVIYLDVDCRLTKKFRVPETDSFGFNGSYTPCVLFGRNPELFQWLIIERAKQKPGFLRHFLNIPKINSRFGKIPSGEWRHKE